MKSAQDLFNDEGGSVLVVALLVLALLTVVGISATRTSQVEQRLSGNEKNHKLAFYAAEAAGVYAANNPDLYGPLNTAPGGDPHLFPILDPTEPYVPNISDDPNAHPLTATQRFKGEVQFLGAIPSPRGSGTEVGTFRAYQYRTTCIGYGPSGAESRVEAGFYRTGF